MKKLLLIAIILVASFFRLYQLGVNPPSLTWDEVAWGYNAYSLGTDGRDEFGRFLPITYLESFGDFKPPMYAYLDIFPVKLLGLNAFATRLPSALFGIAAVGMSYLLVKRLFPSSNKKEWYALATAGILAISRWHIMLSRAAFEANVATGFLIAGVWLFLGGMREKKWYSPLSIACFVLSMYTFNTSRIVAPLLVVVLGVSFYKKLLENKKMLFTAILTGLILGAPLVPFLLSPQAALRFKEVNIFSDSSVVKTSNQEIANDHNTLWSKVIHNRRFLYGLDFLQHYFDNLSPKFLFVNGDGNPKFSTQDVGELYFVDLPFLVLGIYLLFKKKEGSWYLIPLWLLLGIIPAATARETPHALRIETTLPTFQLLVGYGLVNSLLLLKKYRKALLGIFFVLLGVNTLYFLHGYFVHYPREFSSEWQYGYKDAIAYTSLHSAEYQHIAMTEGLGRPYIYMLFYTKTSPQVFRQDSTITRDPFGFVHVERVGKYRFETTLSVAPNTLYINLPSQVPNSAHVLKTFSLVNGQPALVAYTL